MTAYIVIDLDIADPEGMQEYIQAAAPLIVRMGGRMVGFDPQVRVLEGDWKPASLVLIEFPDQPAAQAFWDSAEYQPLKVLRQKHSQAKAISVNAG